MIEDPLDDVGPDALFLIGLVDNDVPDRRAIYEIREDTAESHQLISVPGAERHIGMAEHLFRVLERPILGPGGLMEEAEQLRSFEIFLFGERNCRLEGGRHLVLECTP